jgi:predicted metalloendopeptidase
LIIANSILENLDETANPCENFYQFSCGSFEKRVRIPDDQAKVDGFNILRDKLSYAIAG